MCRAIACFLCLGVLFCFLGCRDKSESVPLLEMICLDVGQGHATLLRTPEGDVLVDAGPEDRQVELCQRLQSLGVERLALLILTHSDEDHIGGADGVLEQLEVDEIWINGAAAENDSWGRLTDWIVKKNVLVSEVKSGDGISFGQLHISILSPVSHVTETTNENSLVLLIRCVDFGALIMGDVSAETEMALIDAYGEGHLRADVLLVGHHGANTSTCVDFLDTVRPRYAVISCGAGNPYGHPDGRALMRLETANAEILRTDLLGDIRFRVSEDEFYYVKDERTEGERRR